MFLIKDKFGFTLIEILIYLGLFALIISIIYPILTITIKNYFILKGKIELSNEIKNIFLRIQSEMLKAKNIDILTDWEVVFDQKNEQVAFFLTQPIYLDLQSNKVKGYSSNLSVGSISFSDDLYSVNFSSSSNCVITGNNTISSLYSFSGYSWSPNIGWIKFRNTDPEEPVYGVCEAINNELRGFAYNDVVGWISFNCADLGVCGSSNYKVIEKGGYLYGYAWNDVIGWLIFDGKGGRVYLAKKNPYPYFVDLISDPRVFVQDLRFTQLQNSFKVNIKIQGPGGTYNESETAIVLPFR